MLAIVPLGIVTAVVSFILGVTGNFPGVNLDQASDPNADQVTAAFQSVNDLYTSVISDLTSFQTNPDLARAEARRDQLMTYAQSLALQFRGLEMQMRSQLDSLTQQAGTQPAQ